MYTDQELLNKLYDDDEFEYVRFIAFQYYPDYLETPMVLPVELPSIEEIDDVSDEPEELTCIGIQQSGFVPFRDIQTGKKEFVFHRDDYDENEDIQLALTLIGLDKDKFWHVLLYIHYLAERWNTDCVPELPSVHEDIKDLIHALKEEKTLVTIKRRGKKPYSISNPVTLKCLVAFLEYGDGKYSATKIPTYTGRMICHLEMPKDVGLRWQIYDEYCMFKLLFDKYCTDKGRPRRIGGQKGKRDKDLLISRILYMTRLVEDERFLVDRSALHAIKLACSRERRPLMGSGIFL